MKQTVTPTKQIVPKHLLVFCAKKDGAVVNLNFSHYTSAEMAIPLPGDEVLIPEDVSSRNGISNNGFKVEYRQFIYDKVPRDCAGAVAIVMSPIPEPSDTPDRQ